MTLTHLYLYLHLFAYLLPDYYKSASSESEDSTGHLRTEHLPPPPHHTQVSVLMLFVTGLIAPSLFM